MLARCRCQNSVHLGCCVFNDSNHSRALAADVQTDGCATSDNPLNPTGVFGSGPFTSAAEAPSSVVKSLVNGDSTAVAEVSAAENRARISSSEGEGVAIA